MLEIDPLKWININELKDKLYNLKSRKEFESEFNIKLGYLLGKGSFGKVYKCNSLLDK